MRLFRNVHPSGYDFSGVGIDLHSHIIPGIDDGSSSIDESLTMLRQLESYGYRKIIVTPHVISSVYPNTREIILGQWYHLKEMIIKEGIKLEVEASAEYNMDDQLAGKIQSGEVISFGTNRNLLLELPWRKPTAMIDEILDQAHRSGYEVIISHPERYVWLIGKMDLYERLKSRGLLFQLNINSLTGFYGLPIQMMANKLVDAGMIEYVGSDAHHPEHLKAMEKALTNKRFIRLLQSNQLRNASL